MRPVLYRAGRELPRSLGYACEAMEPTDLTIKILQEIRDENRGIRAEISGLRSDVTTEISGLRTEVTTRFDLTDQRFLAVETTLKDLAEQMVMLARGIKTALDLRAGVERRLDDYEQRLRAVEQREPH